MKEEEVKRHNEANDIRYENQVSLTSQFRFCGNSFRADTYRGCSHGCIYCFANNREGKGFDATNNMQKGNHKIIENLFHNAFETRKPTSNINVELLRHRVPLHLGGMSDPFQPREENDQLTLKFLKLFMMQKYPIIISTKLGYEPSEEYFKVLDPRYHAFQISLIGTSRQYVKMFEKNSAPPDDRINFIKKLHSRGFWVSVRIQPLVNLEEAEKVLYETHEFINYCTVEHLKLPKFNDKSWDAILKCLTTEYKANLRSSQNKPEFELNTKYKLDNILYLKKKFKDVKFGCGDNDLHQYSDSLNCCGVDTMPEAFNEWLKYNSMYIKMTGDKTQWSPEANLNGVLNSGSIVKGFKYKDYVNEYYNTIYGDDLQLKLFDL